MKSKKPFLRNNYLSIKNKFGDLASINELGVFCGINPRTIERYLKENFIVACQVGKRKRAVIVDSILPNFKRPSEHNFHSFIKSKGLNRELYCKEQDLINSLGFVDYRKFNKSDFKKITFQNKTLICIVSLNALLHKKDKAKKRVIL